MMPRARAPAAASHGRRPPGRSLRPALIRLHRWSGLAAALLFLTQAVTGILWSNREALTWLLNPEARLAAAGAAAPLDAVLAAIADRAPGSRLDRIDVPKARDAPLVAQVVAPGRRVRVLLISPGTARVLSTGPLTAYPELLAERLHGSLMVGGLGHWIVCGEGLVLAVMAASGLVIWWPGLGRMGGALLVRLSAPPRRFLRELHLAPGTLAAGALLVIGLTGALMAAEPLTTGLVGHFAPVAPDIVPTLPQGPPAPVRLSAQQALARLEARFPGGRLVKVRTLGSGDRLVLAVFVDPRRGNPMAYDMAGLDRATGSLMVYADATRVLSGDALVAWLTPVHSGALLGAWGPLAATSGGLALILLVSTGLINWRLRYRPPRRPPTRRLEP